MVADCRLPDLALAVCAVAASGCGSEPAHFTTGWVVLGLMVVCMITLVAGIFRYFFRSSRQAPHPGNEPAQAQSKEPEDLGPPSEPKGGEL
jgi:hypothetical protein